MTEAEFHHANTFVSQYRQTPEGDAVYCRIAAMINRNEYKTPTSTTAYSDSS
ncbi:hypothetical protein [Methylocucumis oryzae]|uniref:hypothetical protein n=1 Tax=Methylocucumis oryzae TaxID=1632867 RepID=UPI001EF9CCAB|nr:hypothetical protein [Methylocucumis oryzae]